MQKQSHTFLRFFSLRNILLILLTGLIGYMFVYPKVAGIFYNYNREKTMNTIEQS
ncbi:MAG: hypothetical protein WAW59_04930 [Patescibacteria group bacterium]